VYIARQRIESAARTVVGHELLFRPSAVAQGSGLGGPAFDDDLATATVIGALAAELDPADITGDGLLFVNLPRSFVVGDLPMPLEAGRVVLELLERISVDQEVRDGVARLRARGFELALDDLVPGDPRLELVEECAYAKIDLTTVPPAQLSRFVEQMRDAAPHLRLVAEHVETEQDLAAAQAAGFDLYQGYLLSRPAVIGHERLAAYRPTAVLLLQRLVNPRTTTRALAQLAAADPAISSRLLRAVNNVTGVRLGVADLQRAIALLGRERFHALLVLDLVSSISHEDAELPLVVVAGTRAVQSLCPQDPMVAATGALVRMCVRMLGLSQSQVVTWLGVRPATAEAEAACEALDAYLEAADLGVPPELAEPFTPLQVSLAWFEGLHEGRQLMAQLVGVGRGRAH
jgi:EAL and modified HD-GYP domain-containing signal transduction protein